MTTIKRFLLPVLLLHLAIGVNAATYYFSANSGDDNRSSSQAQSSSTPWRTIGKLNSIMSILRPGDQVLFKKGETFMGGIVIGASGNSSQPIVFGSYGSSGAKPIISGFANLTGWNQVRNNVWEASMSAANGKTNMVIMNNKQQAIGRFPNSNTTNGGYLVINSHNGITEVTSSQLSGNPNWTGADIAIRKNRWQIDRTKIGYHVGGTVGFDAGSTSSITDKYGFFIENHTNTLDQNGEWFYDKNRNKLQMYFGNNNPGSYNVKGSVTETLVTISFQSYVKFSNLSFQGANSYTFNLTNSNNITIDACAINFTGINAIQALSSAYLTLSNSTINNTNNNGIYLYWNCSNALITNNLIKNTAVIPGMGQNDIGTHQGIVMRGDNNMVQYNEIDSTGSNAVNFEGNYSTVQNNFINTFGFTVDDCGGIYTGQGLGDNTQYASKTIANNIVINGVGAVNGTDDPTYIATQGIYLDDNSNHITVTGNTTANCGQAGIFNHNSTNNSITNNTMFNNGKEQFLGVRSINPISNVTLTNNIMFSKTATQLASRMESYFGTNNIPQFGNVNNNYYCRPIDDNYLFFDMYYANGQYYTSSDNFQDWKNKFGFDGNSQTTPATFPAFNYTNTNGTNLYPNGGYNQNVWSVASYSSTGDISTVWNPSKLDAGTLQVSAKNYSSQNNFNLTLPTDNSISSNKSYLLTFTLQGGASNGRPMDVYLRQQDAPNKDLTPRNKVSIPASRQNYQFGFTPNSSGRVSIELDVTQPNAAVWVDNVMLQEATITPTNPDDYIVFQYNAGKNSKSFNINGTYYDAKGATYSNNVTLQPYTSIVLFKAGSNQFTTTAPTAQQAISVKGSLAPATASATTTAATDITWEVDNQATTASVYQVERSTDATTFTTIGSTSVKPSAAPASEGATQPKITYQFTDNQPAGGKNYYRIKQVDEKGVPVISKVMLVNNISFKINPNPARDVIHVLFDQPVSAADHLNKEVVIRNTAGSYSKTLPLIVTENMSRADFNVSTLQPGMYILTVTSDGQSFSKMFLKQ